MLQSFADGCIQFIEVSTLHRTDSFAVWRIGDDDSLLGWLFKLSYVALLYLYDIAHSCRLHVVLCYLHHLTVDVVAVQFMRELPLGTVVVVYAFEQVGIVVLPFLEGIFLSVHSRIYVSSHQGSFDEYGAGTAERVDEIALAIPSRQHDESGSQHLVDRCFCVLHLISAQVERFSAGIERNRHVLVRYVQVYPDAGVADAHVRTVARLLAPVVGYGILHSVSSKLRVAEVVREYHSIHEERSVHVHIFLPVDFLCLLIHLVGIVCLEHRNRFQHSDGSAQTEVCPIEHLLVACKTHHSVSYLYVVASKGYHLLSQNLFQTLESLCDYCLFHYPLFLCYGCSCWHIMTERDVTADYGSLSDGYASQD